MISSMSLLSSDETLGSIVLSAAKELWRWAPVTSSIVFWTGFFATWKSVCLTVNVNVHYCNWAGESYSVNSVTVHERILHTVRWRVKKGTKTTGRGISSVMPWHVVCLRPRLAYCAFLRTWVTCRENGSVMILYSCVSYEGLRHCLMRNPTTTPSKRLRPFIPSSHTIRPNVPASQSTKSERVEQWTCKILRADGLLSFDDFAQHKRYPAQVDGVRVKPRIGLICKLSHHSAILSNWTGRKTNYWGSLYNSSYQYTTIISIISSCSVRPGFTMADWATEVLSLAQTGVIGCARHDMSMDISWLQRRRA